MKPYKSLKESLREVRVEFADGSSLETSMAAHLSDKDIKDYYKIGTEFNLGSVDKDKMVKVKKVVILR